MEVFGLIWSETALSTCVGLRGYIGEHPGFLGGTNSIL